jgi:hypothetical protein
MDAAITQIQQIAANNLVATVKYAFAEALAERGTIDAGVLKIEGMSGRKFRFFLNNLIRLLPDPRYLEVGSWQGSTLCSAINGNTVRATAIDNWSEFGGPRDAFLANVSTFKSPTADLRVIENDFRSVDYSSIGKFNVFLFDGPRGLQDQHDGVSLVMPALDSRFVLLVNDWNWSQVRTGTLQAIVDHKLSLLYGLEIRTTLDNTHAALVRQNSDWHNGCFIAVLQKPSAKASVGDDT